MDFIFNVDEILKLCIVIYYYKSKVLPKKVKILTLCRFYGIIYYRFFNKKNIAVHKNIWTKSVGNGFLVPLLQYILYCERARKQGVPAPTVRLFYGLLYTLMYQGIFYIVNLIRLIRKLQTTLHWGRSRILILARKVNNFG